MGVLPPPYGVVDWEQCRDADPDHPTVSFDGGSLMIIGIILIVIGAILAIVGSTGRAVGGRRHYF